MASILVTISYVFLACNASFSYARQVRGSTNGGEFKREEGIEFASPKENLPAVTRTSRKEMKEETTIASSASASAAAFTNRSKPEQDSMSRNWKLQDVKSYLMALSTADYRTPETHPPKNN